MAEENIENKNSQNLENEENLENKSQDNDSEDAEESVETLKQKNQSLYEQLKKAKGFTRDDDGNWIKKQETKITKEEPKAKSDEFGYDKKAFLTANGIKGSKEFDFVKEEAKKSGMELDDLLENEYFQSKLEKFRALNKTSEATIKGKDSKGIQTDSVEYWMSKPIEEVPHEMRIKVVNAKLKQAESKGKFYNSK